MFFLSCIVLVFPTILMGGTLPLLTRALVQHRDTAEGEISRLYGINTLGAACGTFLASYVLLRFLGIYGTIAVAVVANFFIFYRAIKLRSSPSAGLAAQSITKSAPQADTGSCGPVTENGVIRFGEKRLWYLMLVTAFATGFITFTYEIVWTHLLAAIIGTSVYSFGLMLFTVLLGIGTGSMLVSKNVFPKVSRLKMISFLQLGLGLYILLTLPLWDKLSYIFYAGAILYPSFYLMEAIRMLVSFIIIFAPCVALGATFPLVLRLSVLNLECVGRSVGIIYAVNTVGCILGAALTGFWLLGPLSSRTLLILGGSASLAIGLVYVAFLWKSKERLFRLAFASVAAALLIFVVLMPGWNMKTLVSANNVYFGRAAGQKIDEFLFFHEDTQSGFTSVTKEKDSVVLRTNGKFEGNNTHQTDAQYGFALIPLLFLPSYGDALNIGYGTGSTAGALSRFPFESIDIAEISPGILMASPYFEEINFNVLDDPRVEVHLNDGRNFLLITKKKYDLITIEISSIWFAGAANLYNLEFYALCKDKLNEDGILQQWVQLHHMDRLDLIVILNTIRRVFSNVSLWIRGGQGMLIAGNTPQVIDYAHIHDMNTRSQARVLKDNLAIKDFSCLLACQALASGDVDNVIGHMRDEIGLGDLGIKFLTSRDYFPYLEYATPMGNALRWAKEANLKFIEDHSSRKMPSVAGVPDGETLQRMKIIYAFEKKNCDRSLHLLDDYKTELDPVLKNIAEACRQIVTTSDY